MPEDRQQQHRRKRVADALRDEIGAILEGELGDPRIGLVTVSEVVLESGTRLARIYLNAVGDEDEATETMKGIEAAKGFIRHKLGANLGLRRAPELIFHLDRSERYGGRIEDLLGRIKKSDKKKKIPKE